MKKIASYLIGVFLVSMMAWGCEKDEIEAWSGVTNIYFEGANEYYSYDSTGMTFGYSTDDVTDSIVSIPVIIQGPTVDYDREFLVTTIDGTTAVAGEHYTLPEQLFIYADSVNGTVPITFHRTEDMKTDTITLVLTLVANDNFQLNMISGVPVSSSSDDEMSYTTVKVSVNDLLSEPTEWSEYYFGSYSEKKLLLLNEICDMPLDALNTTDTRSQWVSWSIKLQRWLDAQAAAGTPVYEEDGSLMYTYD